MKLLNCASVLAVLAISSVPAPVTVMAAETAKAMLKDAKGQDVGSVSLIQTAAGVLLRLSLKDVPTGEHAFHIHVRYETVEERRAAMIAKGWHPSAVAALEEAMEPKFLRELKQKEKLRAALRERGIDPDILEAPPDPKTSRAAPPAGGSPLCSSSTWSN